MWWLLFACAADPLAEAGSSYVAEMQPLFVQNRALGESMLQLASTIKRGAADPAELAAQVSGTALHTAQDVARQAEQVHPADASLTQGHARLVAAWKHRAEAYAAVSAAWTAHDTAAFDRAVADAARAATEESAAADALAAALEPAGVQLDIYP